MLLAAASALYAPLAPRAVRYVSAIVSGYRFCRRKFRISRDSQGFVVVLALEFDLTFLNGLFKRSQKAPYARTASGAGCTAIGDGTYRLRSWRPRAYRPRPCRAKLDISISAR